MIDAAFPPEPQSVPAARRFVRTALDELGVPGALDAAEMLVSEAATNAVLHARTDFVVEVAREGERVRVSVADSSPVLPRQRDYGIDATTGRGVRLIATLAAAWGVDRTPEGKTVWFEIDAADGRSSVEESWDSDADLDALLAGYDDLEEPEGSSGSPSSFFQLLSAPASLRRAA
ncbi:MAG: putative sensor protein [Frankiales bacterium]|nr:putative sensor protein [Frankiales bacterium]